MNARNLTGEANNVHKPPLTTFARTPSSADFSRDLHIGQIESIVVKREYYLLTLQELAIHKVSHATKHRINYHNCCYGQPWSNGSTNSKAQATH